MLLLSLLDGFRDLTRAGVMSFDFNHLNNVLISRDYRKARIIDIDGNAQASPVPRPHPKSYGQG